jgi:hypothetical protein
LYYLERNGKLNSRLGFGHHDFREFYLYSDNVILNLTGYAVICVSVVPLRIEFGYSAHVSTLYALLFQPAERTTLSHELWEYNRTVVGLTFALLLANTGSFIYSLCLSLPGTKSPEHIFRCGHISRALGWRYLSD